MEKRDVSMLFAAALFTACTPAMAHETHKASPARKEISGDQHPWGRQGDPRKAVRTIAIDMADTLRFTPAEVKVKQGDYRLEEQGLGPQEQIVVFTLRSLLPRPIGVSSPGWTDVRSS